MYFYDFDDRMCKWHAFVFPADHTRLCELRDAALPAFSEGDPQPLYDFLGRHHAAYARDWKAARRLVRADVLRAAVSAAGRAAGSTPGPMFSQVPDHHLVPVHPIPWKILGSRTSRLARLRELGAPPEIVQNERELVLDCLTELFDGSPPPEPEDDSALALMRRPLVAKGGGSVEFADEPGVDATQARTFAMDALFQTAVRYCIPVGAEDIGLLGFDLPTVCGRDPIVGYVPYAQGLRAPYPAPYMVPPEYVAKVRDAVANTKMPRTVGAFQGEENGWPITLEEAAEYEQPEDLSIVEHEDDEEDDDAMTSAGRMLVLYVQRRKGFLAAVGNVLARGQALLLFEEKNESC
ncbi:MAG: hypothetical protein Q8P18_29265 [Pseudomonadota bacterium]|nr:hypothetical protein [Pseudomonadota bacterium]